MNRGLLGFCILLAFLVLGLWSAKAMTDFHEPISTQLEQAAQMALTGDFQQATQTARQAKDQWDTHWGRVALLADHTPMDEIDGLFARLEAFADAGNANHFAACCNQLAVLLSATAEAHTLSWKNLL